MQFLRGMHSFGALVSPLVVSAFDLSQYRHLVDVGGATGHIAQAACLKYPRMKATGAEAGSNCHPLVQCLGLLKLDASS